MPTETEGAAGEARMIAESDAQALALLVEQCLPEIDGDDEYAEAEALLARLRAPAQGAPATGAREGRASETLLDDAAAVALAIQASGREDVHAAFLRVLALVPPELRGKGAALTPPAPPRSADVEQAWRAVEDAIEAHAVARHEATLRDGTTCSPRRINGLALATTHEALEDAIRAYGDARAKAPPAAGSGEACLPGLEPVSLEWVVRGHIESFAKWADKKHDPESVTPDLKAALYRQCITHAQLLAGDAGDLLELLAARAREAGVWKQLAQNARLDADTWEGHATAARARVAELEGEREALAREVSALRTERRDFWQVGTLLSNIAFNLSQDAKLPEHTRTSLRKTYGQWDELTRRSSFGHADALAGARAAETGGPHGE